MRIAGTKCDAGQTGHGGGRAHHDGSIWSGEFGLKVARRMSDLARRTRASSLRVPGKWIDVNREDCEDCVDEPWIVVA